MWTGMFLFCKTSKVINDFLLDALCVCVCLFQCELERAIIKSCAY